MPRNQITVAWAVEVSLAQLVARLLAYAETKAAISTFRLCAEKTTTSPALRALPEEILQNIDQWVRQMAFQARISKLVKLSKCMADKCDVLSHLSSREHEGLYGDYYEFGELDPDGEYEEVARNRHRNVVTKHCAELAGSKKASRHIQSAIKVCISLRTKVC